MSEARQASERTPDFIPGWFRPREGDVDPAISSREAVRFIGTQDFPINFLRPGESVRPARQGLGVNIDRDGETMSLAVPPGYWIVRDADGNLANWREEDFEAKWVRNNGRDWIAPVERLRDNPHLSDEQRAAVEESVARQLEPKLASEIGRSAAEVDAEKDRAALDELRRRAEEAGHVWPEGSPERRLIERGGRAAVEAELDAAEEPRTTLMKVGVIGVDSGRIMLLDPCYEGKVRINDVVTDLGIADVRHVESAVNLGVVVPTGVGDGLFPVIAEIVDGKLNGILLDFGDDDLEKGILGARMIARGEEAPEIVEVRAEITDLPPEAWQGSEPAAGTRRALIRDTIAGFFRDTKGSTLPGGLEGASLAIADSVEAALLQSTIDDEAMARGAEALTAGIENVNLEPPDEFSCASVACERLFERLTEGPVPNCAELARTIDILRHGVGGTHRLSPAMAEALGGIEDRLSEIRDGVRG